MEADMKWTFNLFQVRGIAIKMHGSFVLILALGGFEWGRTYGLGGFAFGALLTATLFVCVTLHELGHSIAAQRYGIPVKEIVLLPIGGVALLEEMPKKPRQELVIAAAGPAVNVGIAALIAVLAGPLVSTGMQGLTFGVAPEPSVATFFTWLLAANIMLIVFNMIPAFPLDGGRMLRAVLAMSLEYTKATEIAARIGQLAAVGLGLFGLLSGNFILTLIAVFIFFGAGAESAQARAHTVLTGRRIGEATNTHALTLSPNDRLSTVTEYILRSYQPDFAVLFGDRLFGVVTRDDVLRTLATRDDDPYVAEIMQRDVPQVEASSGFDEVHKRMLSERARLIAVFAGGKFLGLVSRDDIREALSIFSAGPRGQIAEG
jgi:Zn-dependent protease/predicted transcriptional regulator